MALIEMAALPYAALRTTPVRIDRAVVARMVADPLWSDWAPVGILLLGLSDAPADQAFVRRAAGSAARAQRSAHLAAWLTALIEVDGLAALETIRAGWLDGPARPGIDEDLRQVGLALASHAGRTDATGDAIRAATGELAARHPAIAAALVRTMTERQDWSLAGEVVRWLDEGRVVSDSDAFLLNAYVLAATETEIPE
jgi:hypothetical protein